MPTEWPPKKPAPKAVRRALAEIDALASQYAADLIPRSVYIDMVFNRLHNPLDAARAWLAQQDGETHE